MKALDISFSSASLAWCRARKAEGWELLIVDLWTGVSTPAPARANLANARQAGMLTAGYTVVNNLSGIIAINKAATAAGPEWDHLSFVSVDVEVATTSAIIRETVDGLRAQRKLVCIYTGGWFWNLFIQQGGDFSDVSAWLADYDNNPALDTAQLTKLGPVIGKQYRGSHDSNGVTVDANTFEDSFVQAFRKEKKDMPNIYKGPGGAAVLESGIPIIGQDSLDAYQQAGYATINVTDDQVQAMGDSFKRVLEALVPTDDVGGLTLDEVKEATKEALREGTG